MNPSEPFLPVVKPLVLCEDVLTTPGRGNVHLINVFTIIRSRTSPSFPYRKPLVCVYAQLSDAEGEIPTWVEVVEASSQQMLIRTVVHPVVFPHRRMLHRVIYRIEQCPFPRPGTYLVQLFGAGHFLADQVFRVLGPGAAHE